MRGSGTDYGHGITNINTRTGIRYGVIKAYHVDYWADSSEPVYPNPEEGKCLHCNTVQGVACTKNWGDWVQCVVCGEEFELNGSYIDPMEFTYDGEGLQASQLADDPDIFVLLSPYYTKAAFCSPCAPGAIYLLDSCDAGERGYCFGHDWFESGVAPYPVYSVETGELIPPPEREGL